MESFGGAGEFDFISNRSAGNNGGYFFYDYTNSGALNALMMLHTSGTGASLEINGGVKLTSGSLDAGRGVIEVLVNLQ